MTEHDRPEGEDPMVWSAACAIALERHPNASWPQPSDIKYARIALKAAAGVAGQGWKLRDVETQ